MLCQVRDRTVAGSSRCLLRVLATTGLAIVATAGLASPESARAQMCDSAAGGAAAGGTTGGGGAAATGGGTASAGNALSMVQSAGAFVQMQQQRNRQLQQLRQQQMAWLNARRAQSIRDDSETSSRRVGSAEVQARREERKRLQEERWALRKTRLNRMREEIELAKAAEAERAAQVSTRETSLASLTAQ